MTKFSLMTLLVFFSFSMLFSSGAEANDAGGSMCDQFSTPGQQKQLANCKAILKRNLVPNKRALAYTMKYLDANRGSLRDPRCATAPGAVKSNDRCVACRDENWIKSGIENGCSFIINDLKRPWRREPARNRTTGYYVDLCSDDPNKIVTTFYINGGKTSKPPFSDAPDSGPEISQWNTSTLAGAFKIEGQVYGDFKPITESKYTKIREANGGKIPALRMIGLNSSNNTTEDSKPMHVSAFRTGLGCPGVAQSTAAIFDKITASGGSSLMMAYAGPEFEQKGDSCVNDTSDASLGAPPPAGSTTTTTTGGSGANQRRPSR